MQSISLELILNLAFHKANQLKHEYLTIEIIFLSVLTDPEVQNILRQCGADLDKMNEELLSFINDESNFSILTDEEIKELSAKQFTNPSFRLLASENGILYQPEVSLSLGRMFQRAAIHVQSSGKKDILGVNLLIATFNEE